jgi:outer membrane biosynthesis protein TonB
VDVVSGPTVLAQASKDAVKQWKFKPHVVNGRAAEMQTRVTFNFKLPE